MNSATHQNLTASKAIVPCLTISVHGTFAIDFDVSATPNHESDALLEGIVKIVVLPVLDIIGELNWYSISSNQESDLISSPSMYHPV